MAFACECLGRVLSRAARAESLEPMLADLFVNFAMYNTSHDLWGNGPFIIIKELLSCVTSPLSYLEPHLLFHTVRTPARVTCASLDVTSA